MNTNKLEYFLTVYELGSMTAAARKHYISQVAMSQQIISLEEELGVKLFRREKKRLVQTSAAHYFYQEASRILKEYNQVLENMRQYANDDKRVLRVGINYFSLYEVLKPCTSQFEREYEDISISFKFFPSNELISQLSKGFLDVILIWDRYAVNMGFATRQAFTSRAAVLVPKGHPLFGIEDFSYDLIQPQRVVMLVEELPYFSRTGRLEELLNQVYTHTCLRRSDIIISDNVNEAMLLALEEKLMVFTYEDKLYKIPQTEMRQFVLKQSFMECNYVYAWQKETSNPDVETFISSAAQWNF